MHRRDLQLREVGQLNEDSRVPCFPVWLPAGEALLVHAEGPPYRRQVVAHVATWAAVWRHLVLARWSFMLLLGLAGALVGLVVALNA